MARTGVAKLFRNGRSQAVRLPQEFRFEGDRVRVRRVPGGVLLEPFVADPDKWFEELDRWAAVPFMEDDEDAQSAGAMGNAWRGRSWTCAGGGLHLSRRGHSAHFRSACRTP